jgi:hypothetical protein
MPRSTTKYWLIPHAVHVADFPYWSLHATEWTVECDATQADVHEGDIIYLANGETGIYAWGMVVEVNVPVSEGEQGSIKISRGAIKPVLIERNKINGDDALRDLLSFSGGKFNFLLNRQVKALNSMIPPRTPKPPTPTDQQYVINQAVSEDEGLHIEYKEVAINSIPGDAYDYAVAYLTQKGGRVLFGVRDSDHNVVGVTADMNARDRIKKTVENKLSTISPQILPVRDYWLDFHQVIDHTGEPVADCFVFELEINETESKDHRTAGGKSYLKSFSGKIRIS